MGIINNTTKLQELKTIVESLPIAENLVPELEEQDDLIEQILEALGGKVNDGGSGSNLVPNVEMAVGTSKNDMCTSPMYETNYNEYLWTVAVNVSVTIPAGKTLLALCEFYTRCKEDSYGPSLTSTVNTVLDPSSTDGTTYTSNISYTAYGDTPGDYNSVQLNAVLVAFYC